MCGTLVEFIRLYMVLFRETLPASDCRRWPEAAPFYPKSQIAEVNRPCWGGGIPDMLGYMCQKPNLFSLRSSPFPNCCFSDPPVNFACPAHTVVVFSDRPWTFRLSGKHRGSVVSETDPPGRHRLPGICPLVGPRARLKSRDPLSFSGQSPYVHMYRGECA